MLMETSVEVRSSKFGKGLFAVKDFKNGEIICTATGTPLSFNDTLHLGERESHALQIGKDRYILCDPPFLYTNHSCHPNCGLNENLQLLALEDIKKGEEFFWDYSTSMLERHWTMQCHCGETNCRGIIKDFDLLPVDIQNGYIQKKMVLRFIMEELIVDNTTTCTA